MVLSKLKKIAASFLLFTTVSLTAQANESLGFLTHEEFLSLYTADQVAYMKLLQTSAVELSLNADYVASRPPFFQFLQAMNQLAEAQTTPAPVPPPAAPPPAAPQTPQPAVSPIPAPVPGPAPAARACARCIYGGFTVYSEDRCTAVSSLADTTHRIVELRLPEGITRDSLACAEAGKPVLCNPVLYGFKENGPVCVAKQSAATRACHAASNKTPEGYEQLRQFLITNRAAFIASIRDLETLCISSSSCHRSLSAARRTDIRSTCTAIRNRLSHFRRNMRTEADGTILGRTSPAASPAPGLTPGPSPAPAPTPGPSGQP